MEDYEYEDEVWADDDSWYDDDDWSSDNDWYSDDDYEDYGYDDSWGNDEDDSWAKNIDWDDNSDWENSGGIWDNDDFGDSDDWDGVFRDSGFPTDDEPVYWGTSEESNAYADPSVKNSDIFGDFYAGATLGMMSTSQPKINKSQNNTTPQLGSKLPKINFNDIFKKTLGAYTKQLNGIKDSLRNAQQQNNAFQNKQLDIMNQLKNKQLDLYSRQLDLSQKQFEMAQDQWNQTKQELNHIRNVRQHITQKYFS